ncbi:hypothetical protein C8R44DRAFT_986784 [Mycena epipterygia]|nr:hypothetical protein C8R44DRAFT_986784 [Mycena epipterygia]
MYPKDGLARKGLVLICVIFCTVALIADCANVFLSTVTYWGDVVRTQKQYWPSPLFVTTNTFIGVLVNSYLIQRFYNLSKNLWISAILFLFVVLGFVGSIMVAIALVAFSDYSSRNKLKLSALIWIISTAAAGMCWLYAAYCTAMLSMIIPLLKSINQSERWKLPDCTAETNA